ncbi:purple acid phosphatase family protein [Paenibacillus pinistramenti]|uniref:purple acid phosphatase family protein n=1 Tax=Paenibacillus pinistramenti TaxID=1768003 RepID=UPI001EF0A7E4|nr:metallophosphoesterase family protein [Paenibacillus pinistramenti]
MGKMKDFWWIAVAGLLIIGVVLYLGRIAGRTENTAGGTESKNGGPYDIVTTFKSDPQTSRAFTWYTDDAGEETVVQLLKGEGTPDFSSADLISVQGETTVYEGSSGQQKGVHKAEASGLEPGTAYTYRVGSPASGKWSEPASFTTEEQDLTAFSFINITDSQGVNEADFAKWGQTLSAAFKTFSGARFVIHNGDLTEDPADEAGWKAFFADAQPWISEVPLMPVTGNHDEVDKQADAYVSHFNLPDNGAEGSNPGTSYSFDYGNAHFVVLNTESNIKKQTDWLKQDLKNTDKEWIIAALHRPPYGGSMYDKVDDWVELFDQYHVDLVLQGHNHEYSRSYPLKGGKITDEGNGTVYVVTNASGSKFNEKKSDKFYHAVHFQNNKQMFAGIQISGSTLTYSAYDVDGNKLDEFVLKH